jgi:DNA (cytosine-5)-methyltransferase 1
MRLLDTFAGVGGFSLAAHWMGWETAAFVEWEEYPQKVLKKNFPGVPVYSDIRDFHYEEEIGPIDIVCGGFPCQPFSSAGKRKGAADDRYLWPEMLRVIKEAGPSWVVGENVAGILSMDGGAVFEEICTSLENEGYEVWAFIIPAISKGAPHRRDRVWIVAYSERRDEGRKSRGVQEADGREGVRQQQSVVQPGSTGEAHGQDFANTKQKRPQRVNRLGEPILPSKTDRGFNPANPSSTGLSWGKFFGTLEKGIGQPQSSESVAECDSTTWGVHWYEAATCLCGMDHGLPSWVDRHRSKRLKALGNSIVPQVAYEIFKAINEMKNNP